VWLVFVVGGCATAPIAARRTVTPPAADKKP